ncbi:iron reductase [Scytonema hofmannii PCC 7110]|uniref:Iron reductase n=1 Tax=Scytonema hofmannii PCC 7110 TaxID=128403 RepID=A0A139WS92_9CYAN|nr:ferric reductase-like transmembrane domain-containing protein [Scytonema hofmannii]KYC35302.1 iron reductase [Scytonema hofmannii PCC 7110]
MSTIDTPTLETTLGFLALVCYILTLLPTILRIVIPHTKETGILKLLLKHRRSIGILAFLFALGHGFLLVQKRRVDLFDLKTSWIYNQGLATFTIFTLLAITSNDWSRKKLKKNWKQLHKLTYLAMFLLTWHIWDKMSGHWTYLTPIGLVAIMGIIILYLFRLGIESQDKQQKKEGKAFLSQLAVKTFK